MPCLDDPNFVTHKKDWWEKISSFCILQDNSKWVTAFLRWQIFASTRLFLMVFTHFKLFWIFTKLSVENKPSVNNSRTSCTIVKRKIFLDLWLIFSKHLKRDREDGAENTTHLKFTSSVLLDINCSQIIILELSKHSEEQNFVFCHLNQIFLDKIITQISINGILKTFYWHSIDVICNRMN